MTSPANEADVARMLERAAQECESKQGVWLGGGLPQALKDSTGSQVEPESADLAFVEVATVSPNGIATTIDLPPSLSCRLIGLSASPYKAVGRLFDRTEFKHIA